MRFAIAALLLTSPAAADDTFNCPKPVGTLAVDEELYARAMPTNTDAWMPSHWEVDYRCRVDGNGHLVDCVFASRQVFSEFGARRMNALMPRVMRATTTDQPNQPCVAGKITFRSGSEANASDDASSVTSPDEAARQREVPDRTD